jgi:predicted glycosyltransferase
MSARYLLYSHDGLGLGHVQRNLAVARALRRADSAASVLLATSVDDVGALGVPDGTDIVRLPALRKVANDRYEPRRLPISGRRLRSLRSELLLAAVHSYQPDAMLVDKHPLGVRGELSPALAALRAVGGRAVLGLRDILDHAAAVRKEWSAGGVVDAIASYYAHVLVYGQREIYDAVADYAIPQHVAAHTTYCGYVVATDDDPVGAPPPPARSNGRPLVLATVGGGEDGSDVLRVFLRTAAESEWDAVVVGGPLASRRETGRLRDLATKAGARFHRLVPRLQRWFPAVDALVCMGGYNTLSAALATATPTVVVPRVRPRAEQLLRTRAFAAKGLLRSVDPAVLSRSTLGDAIDDALSTTRTSVATRVSATLRLDGAARAADVLAAVAAKRDHTADASALS